MILKSLNTKKDYQTALKRLEIIFDAKPGTAEGDELEVLAMQIYTYEQEHSPIDSSDRAEAIN